MVVLQRSAGAAHVRHNGALPDDLLAEFEVQSAEGNERLAIDRVAAAVGPLGLPAARLERLKTAVGEATMNAMEHGNGYRADRPVTVRVLSGGGEVRVQITDLGRRAPESRARPRGPRPRGQARRPAAPARLGPVPDRELVDEMRETSDGGRHTLELALRLEGGDDDDE